MLNTSLNTLQEGNVAGKKFRESHKKKCPTIFKQKVAGIKCHRNTKIKRVENPSITYLTEQKSCN